MGGGGGFIQNIVDNVVDSFADAGHAIESLAHGDIAGATSQIINSTVNSFGFDDVLTDPIDAKKEAEQKAKEISDQRLQMDALNSEKAAVSAQSAEQEGGTPTANAASASANAAQSGVQAKVASGSAAALSQSQQAINQSAGSGTLLTGNAGVDPQSLELGKRTLLGG